jgi:hypothetical protein
MELASLGVARRKKFANDWEMYRLHDSEVVLPIINQHGKKVSVHQITVVREIHRNVSSDSSIPSGVESLDTLRALQTRKQRAEHDLMMYSEQRKERQAGNMLLKAVKGRRRLLESENKSKSEPVESWFCSSGSH